MTADMEIPAELEALVLATVAKEASKRKDAAKAVLNQAYKEGQTNHIRSPLGEKLGTVLKTDPDPRWTVTDSGALDAHLRTFEGATETYYEIASVSAAVDHLREHAPELLVKVTRVRQDVIDAAIAESRETGEPAAPGIERVKPAGVLTVTPDKQAAAAVSRLVSTGVIDWQGRPLAIEAAREAS